MPAALQALDIVVSASITENAPLCLLEAMAAGKAIITTDSGGSGEVIQNRVNGLVVPVRDSKAIAEGILFLLEEPMIRRALGDSARKASEQYDIRLTVKQIEKCCEDVAVATLNRQIERPQTAG